MIMKRGEITVFLALVMSLLLSLVITVIEGARINTIRFQIECAADLGVYSALAGYRRELLDRFDLFFIDMSYGTGNGSVINTQEYIRDTLEYNLRPQKELAVYQGRDLLELSPKEAVILNYSGAADRSCLVLKSQAVDFMKDKTGLNMAEGFINDMKYIETHDMESGEVENLRYENQRELARRDNFKVKDGKDEVTGKDKWKTVKIDNPVSGIPIEDGSLEFLVTKNSGGVSGRQIVLEETASNRELQEGNGPAPERRAAAGPADEFLFGEYLLEHSSYYTKQREDAFLKYQIEYILAGKGGDRDNLKAVLNRLLVIREVSNYLYLLTDQGRTGQAETAAAAVSAVVFQPELEELLKHAILLAWAYTESVNDLKLLLEGGRVPLIKDNGSWHMGFTDMFHYKDCLGRGAGSSEGRSYEDYLRMLLLMQNPEEKAVRFADMLETDIRRLPGGETFKIDNCMESMEVEITAESLYGYEYSIRKRYGYEMLE